MTGFIHPSFWFYLLIALGIACIGYTLIRIRDRSLVPYFMLLVSFAYLQELFVFVFMQSYTYKPGIVDRPYVDSLLGAFISQTLAVPSVALAIAAFDLGLPWIMAGSLAFSLMDWAFLKLGVFEHHWWRSPYTGLLLLFYFYTGIWWWTKLRDGRSKGIQIITAIGCYITIAGLLAFIVGGLLGIYQYRVSWFNDPWRNSSAFSAIMILITSVYWVIFAVDWRSVNPLWWVALPVVSDVILTVTGHLSTVHPLVYLLRIAGFLILAGLAPIISSLIPGMDGKVTAGEGSNEAKKTRPPRAALR